MALRTRETVVKSIRTRARTIKGKTYECFAAFLGKSVISNRPIRIYATNRKELIEKIDTYYGKDGVDQEMLTMLTHKQILDAKIAYYTIAESGLKLSLTDCVKAAISQQKAVAIVDKPIVEAYNEYLGTLTEGANKSKTICTVGRWAEISGADAALSTVSLQSVKSYLNTYYGDKAAVTYNSHLSYLGTFFNWCAHPMQRYLAENPIKELVKKPVAWKRPKYMKPEVVKRIMEILWAARNETPDQLALAVTQFFVGVRREEALRIADEESVTLLMEDETLRVERVKGYTRGRAPRTAQLPPNALAWMRAFPYVEALKKIHPSTTQNLMRRLKNEGVEWFHNCARHTFITMHVAKYHTPQVTQAMVGTSGTMRADHYDGLAPSKEGEAYFNIMPPTEAPITPPSA